MISPGELWWIEERRRQEDRAAFEAARAEAAARVARTRAAVALLERSAVVIEAVARHEGERDVDGGTVTHTEQSFSFDTVELAAQGWVAIPLSAGLGTALTMAAAVGVGALAEDDGAHGSLAVLWGLGWAFDEAAAHGQRWFRLDGPGDPGLRWLRAGDSGSVRIHGPFGSRAFLTCKLVRDRGSDAFAESDPGLDGVASDLRVTLAVQWLGAPAVEAATARQPILSDRYTLKPHRRELDALAAERSRILDEARYRCPNRSCSNFDQVLESVQCPVCRHYSRS